MCGFLSVKVDSYYWLWYIVVAKMSDCISTTNGSMDSHELAYLTV